LKDDSKQTRGGRDVLRAHRPVCNKITWQRTCWRHSQSTPGYLAMRRDLARAANTKSSFSRSDQQPVVRIGRLADLEKHV